jgi:hypothetical protein
VIARELAEGPTLVLGYTKSAVVYGWQTPPETAYRHRDRRSTIRNELKTTRRASRHFAINAHPAPAAAKAVSGHD